jgi:hypothetical protein
MQKVTIHHEAQKGLRINRFGRPLIELVTKEENVFNGWASEYAKFTSPSGKVIFVKREWEKERLAKSELCYTNSEYKNDGLCNNIIAFSKTYSVKAALRKIKKYAHLFPSGTTFTDFGGWINYGVSFVIRNDEYDEEKIKELLYKDLVLGKRYSRLSNNEQFNNLVIALRNVGYLVSVSDEIDDDNIYWAAFIKSKNIRAGFCTKNDESNQHLSGQFCAENEECFDKWSNCSIEIDIPETQEKIDLLIKELEYLASEEGEEESNHFDYKFKFLK